MFGLQLNFLRVLPYLVGIALYAGLYWYGQHEHSERLAADKLYSDYIALETATRLADKTLAENNLKVAGNKINSQAAKVQAQEDALKKLGITREQTKKELDDAIKSNNEILISRNNVLDGLNRMQSTTSKDNVRTDSATEVLPVSREECIRAGETVRVIKQASIFAVNDYDTCITQLKAIYKQHDQEINFTDE